MARTLDQIIRDTLSNQLVEIARLQSALEQHADEIQRLHTLCTEHEIDPNPPPPPPKNPVGGSGAGRVGVASDKPPSR